MLTFDRRAALLSIALAALAVALLASLHVLSPEFSPAWRMISEYGNGRYEWVLSLMFGAWGVSMLSLAFALRAQARGTLGKVGLGLLVVAGIGAVAGGVFDINNEPGHTLSAAAGILGLPAAAILVSIALGRTEEWSAVRRPLLWAAHLTWISVVLLVVTFVVMVVTFLRVDGALPTQVPASVPPGVIALVGWSNRLLVLAYCGWVVTVAILGLRLRSDVGTRDPRHLQVGPAVRAPEGGQVGVGGAHERSQVDSVVGG